MAKHLQCMLLASVLTIPTVQASTDPQKADSLCDQLFSNIKQNEPELTQEMDDLLALCHIDFAQTGPAYWQCVDGFLSSRSYNSDNLILAGHICVNSEQIGQVTPSGQ